jgi:tetratricopeptide (TPR) repeat protein
MMAKAGTAHAQWWLAWTVGFSFWLGLGNSLAAQQDAVRAFHEAALRQEWPVARRLLQAAIRQSPEALASEIDAVEYVLLDEPQLKNGVAPGKSQVDTLFTIYQAAISSDPAAAAPWKARRALLAMRFPRDYPLEALSYVREAVEADPDDCPLHLYTLWIQTAAARYGQGLYPLKKFSLDAAYLDRMLYMRAIIHPDEAEECDRHGSQLRHAVLAAMPPCGPHAGNYRDGIAADVLDVETLKAFLASHILMNCDDQALLDAALRLAARRSPQDAAFARLAAAESMRRNDLATALTHWEQAVAWERDPAMQAGDLLFLSHLLVLRQDYRLARQKLETAQRLQPTWGAPYLRLADLYLDGADACVWSPFDRKALNWLLIDLCEQARAVDPSYATEATRRILLYQAKAPNADELQLRRLQPGDTWPLRCWMATTVKVRVF